MPDHYGTDPHPAKDGRSKPDGGNAIKDGFETLKRAPRTSGSVTRPSRGWTDPARARDIENSDRRWSDWKDSNDYD